MIVDNNIGEVVNNLSILVDDAPFEDQITSNLAVVAKIFVFTMELISNTSSSDDGEIPIDLQQEVGSVVFIPS